MLSFNSPTYLIDLVCELAKADVQIVVAGGVALVIHGVERMTLDLDIALGKERRSLERFLDFVHSNGIVPRAPIPAETILHPESLNNMIIEKGAIVLLFGIRLFRGYKLMCL